MAISSSENSYLFRFPAFLLQQFSNQERAFLYSSLNQAVVILCVVVCDSDSKITHVLFLQRIQ